MQLGEIRRERRGDAYNKVQETYGTEDTLWSILDDRGIGR
jgi:hypothetical protein